MENERELVVLAAKACGYKLDLEFRPVGLPFFHSERRAIALDSGGWFAPGVDDGDCARMEAVLGISVDWSSTNVMCGAWNGAESESAVERYESHSGDKQAARRMASLRVAAEIGRNMQSDKR